jgi:hypothetical protein
VDVSGNLLKSYAVVGNGAIQKQIIDLGEISIAPVYIYYGYIEMKSLKLSNFRSYKQ